MENNQINNPDQFNEIFRSKLENHSFPVDEKMWKAVKKGITPRKKRIPVWFVMSLSVAASLAMVVTVGNYFLKTESTKNPETVSVRQTSKTAVQAVVTAEVKAQKPETQTVAHTIIPAIHTEEVKANEKSSQIAENPATPETKTILPEVNDISISNQDTKTDLAVVSKDTVRNALPDDNQTLAIIQESADWVDQIKKQDMQKPSLAAGFGSGVTGASASRLGKSMDYMAESLTSAKTAYSSIMAPEDFKERNFLPPVSFGLKCTFPVSKKLAIESGLIYSLLITNLTSSYWGGFEADLSLHYLGLPVNLVSSIIQSGKWTIYANTGFMVEKGLWSYYRQYQNWGNAEYNATASERIDGFQWSAQAAFGVSYRFQKEFSGYVEPGLTYYFDGNQPFSIRTEMPLLLGLNAGIRINL